MRRAAEWLVVGPIVAIVGYAVVLDALDSLHRIADNLEALRKELPLHRPGVPRPGMGQGGAVPPRFGYGEGGRFTLLE